MKENRVINSVEKTKTNYFAVFYFHLNESQKENGHVSGRHVKAVFLKNTARLEDISYNEIDDFKGGNVGQTFYFKKEKYTRASFDCFIREKIIHENL